MDPATTNGLSTGRFGPHPWFEWLLLAAAGAILIAFRLHAFDLPLENDECNYAYIGQRLLAGDRMYADVWDHQPPGVFVLFAGVIALFGNAPEVFRWMTVAFSLVSLLLIYAMVRRSAGVIPAAVGAVMFALVSSDPGTAGEGCNRELYMNALILAAWYFVLRCERRSGWMIFASGSALALASAVKTIVAIHWLLLAGWVVWIAGSSAVPQARVRSILNSVALFAAGPLILWVATMAYFAATGRGSEFVDAVFLFNLSYSGAAEPFLLRFVRFFAPPRHPFIFDSALPLWLGAIGGTVWLTYEAAVRRNRETVAVVLLVAAGFIAVCLPARFWPHYYYLLVPAAVVAVSVAVGRLVAYLCGVMPAKSSDASRWLIGCRWQLGAGAEPSVEQQTRPARHKSVWVRGVSILLFAAIPLGLLVTEYRHYLSQPPFGITVKRYNSRDFWGRAQGLNVGRVTDPDDEVFVFGNDAEIYYYSRRRCASRFTMITGLQTGYAGVAQRRKTFMAELRERRPRLILLLFDERHPWDEWVAFLNEYYGQPIGWDLHDKTGEPILAVLARKDKPVEEIDWNWDRSEVGGWMLGDRP